MRPHGMRCARRSARSRKERFIMTCSIAGSPFTRWWKGFGSARWKIFSAPSRLSRTAIGAQPSRRRKARSHPREGVSSKRDEKRKPSSRTPRFPRTRERPWRRSFSGCEPGWRTRNYSRSGLRCGCGNSETRRMRNRIQWFDPRPCSGRFAVRRLSFTMGISGPFRAKDAPAQILLLHGARSLYTGVSALGGDWPAFALSDHRQWPGTSLFVW